MSYTPNVIDRWLHEPGWQNGYYYDAVERRYRWRGGNKPRAIFLHIQEGTNAGSWMHFHSVKASCTTMIAKNGDIWRLVPESDSPWTNGDVCSPTARGNELMNAFGWDPNVYALTIETEGYHHEFPKTARQIASVVWQIRQWMQLYDIPLSRVYKHEDVNQCSRPNCPGDEYFAYIIEQLRNGGDIDVDTPAPAQYGVPSPVVVDGEAWDGESDVEVGGSVYHGDLQTVEVAVATLNRRRWASTTSLLLNEPLTEGITFDVLGWVNGEEVEGERRWWITPSGSRIWVGGTVEKPSVDAPEDAPDTDGDPNTPFVLNGNLYYPMGPDGQGREVTTVVDCNLRQWAGTEFDIVGTAAEGTALTAKYWCEGEDVEGEDIWFVIDQGEDDVLNAGARLSVTCTDSRPR